MTDIRYRNHPTVMVKNIVLVSVIIFFISIGSYDYPTVMMAFVAAVALISAIMVLFWARTTITFCQNEIIVESNILYKRKKTIP
ncbi:MAG: hypothetical protein LBU30_01695, partial [Candidatus Methanoplasma sp.]|nr:hypothetical protein [Candidatus Methanoplasma sp.]